MAYLIEPKHVITAEQLQKVKIGNSASEVRGLLADPGTVIDAPSVNRWEYLVVRPSEPTLFELLTGEESNGEACTAGVSFSKGQVSAVEVWDCTRLAEPVPAPR